MGRNHSATMCSPAPGIRWWISATRPATEFSIGIMPRTASRLATALSASSKGEPVPCPPDRPPGRRCASSLPALPGTRFSIVWSARSWASFYEAKWSRLGQHDAGRFEVVRGVHPERDRTHEGDVDSHAGFEPAQLLELFAPLQRRYGQADEPFKRRPPICV